MTEFRCSDCGKLLAKIKIGSTVEIKCPRCSSIQSTKQKPNTTQSDLIATK